MKRIGIRFLQILLITLIFASCLESNDTEEPTREEEQLNLKKYIDNLITNGHDIDTTDLGVYYVTMDEGTGEYPKNGDTLTVGYAGYFPNVHRCQ